MFMHFWAIPAGMAALSVPFIVHWLTKPNPTRMPLSTVRFVLEVVKQRRTRNRLRDFVILALRVAAIALFAFVLARPLSGNRTPASSEGRAETVRVVLLDVSQSMSSVSNGIQALERARPIAARHVEYGSNTQANLILCAATPHAVFDRPSANNSALLDEVAKAVALPQRLQAQAALNSAAEMLSRIDRDKVRRELIVISDFQRSNWAAADFSALPRDTVIELESVAPVETPANLAIMRVGPQGRVERGRSFRLEVEIGNYSPTPRPVSIEVTIGEHQFRLQGTCTAGGKSILVTEATINTEGWQTGEARLVGIEDGLNDDNRRALVVQVHPQPSYLLLTRQLSDSKRNSSYFLERAILPASASDRKDVEKIVRADPARVERDAITSADLILLDHPGKLSEETLQLIAALMLRGRGVLYVVAEPIDATNLKLLTKAAGTSLQMPVEFSPSNAGQMRKNLFLADVKGRQPPFSVFGDDSAAMVAPLRFDGGLTSHHVDGALLDDICATYNDQSACLVMTPCGLGSLAVLNAELATSNLRSSPVFVPLVGELVSQLLGRARSQETTFSGEPIAALLPPSAVPMAGLEIESPAALTVDPASLGELHEESVGVMWQSAAAGPPGVYSVVRGRESVYALASTIPPDEADLMPLSADLMTTRLAGGRDVKYRSALQDEDPRDDRWSILAVLCVICLCVEFAGLKYFRC